MQTATILYRTHADPDAGLPLRPEAATAAGLDPAWTELAEGGPQAVNDALLKLASRGAGRVEAVPFCCDQHGSIRLGTPRMRLLG